MVERETLGRRDRKKLEVYERIYRTALAEFLDRGPANVTMQDIADRADVARSSVFNYFPTKMDLLAEVYTRFAKRVLDDAKRHDAKNLRGGMQHLYASISHHASGLIPILKDVAPLTLSGQNLSDAEVVIDNQMREFVCGLVREGMKSDEVDLDLDPVPVASLLLSLVSSTNHEWIARGGTEDLEALHQERFSIVFNGLAKK